MTDEVRSRGMEGERFLTFKSEGRSYAVPAISVAEVVRMLPVARVPLSPRSLMGLANLRGSVVPVASVRALLGRNEIAATPASRLIVLGGSTAVALAVDEVTSLARIEAGTVRDHEAELVSEDGEHLRGAFESNHQVTKILDVPELLRRAFIRNEPRQQASVVTASAPNEAPVETVRRRLATFAVAGQEYALPLEAVREIVTMPAGLTFVPGSDGAVRGVMPYRDGLLPLLSLRALLGLPAAITPREKILVVALADALVGFVADKAHEVLSVDPDHVEPAPAVLVARAGGEAQIKEIYRAGHGRLISILAPERLFREDVMQRLMRGDTAMKANTVESRQDTDTQLLFLIFHLDEDEFALPIAVVDEVSRIPDQVTRLPRTPKFLEGVVNIRGEVLPVIDQRRRFDMPPMQQSDRRRLIVVRTEQHRAGLIVDGVSEVLRCSPDSIRPAPDLTGDASALVRSVINLEGTGRIILLLDPAELLTHAERGLLDSFSKDISGKGARRTKR